MGPRRDRKLNEVIGRKAQAQEIGRDIAASDTTMAAQSAKPAAAAGSDTSTAPNSDIVNQNLRMNVPTLTAPIS